MIELRDSARKFITALEDSSKIRGITMKKISGLISLLMFSASIQDLAYSKTMMLFEEECDTVEVTYGKNRIIGCWGSAPDVCKAKRSGCKSDDDPELE